MSIFFYTLKKWTLGTEIKLFDMTLANSTLIPQAAELTSAFMCQEAYNSVTSPGEKQHKCLLTPDWTSTTDQSNNSSKVNLVFIGVTYRNRDDSQVALSSWNVHPTWVMVHRSCIFPALSITCRQFLRSQHVFFQQIAAFITWGGALQILEVSDILGCMKFDLLPQFHEPPLALLEGMLQFGWNLHTYTFTHACPYLCVL